MKYAILFLLCIVNQTTFAQKDFLKHNQFLTGIKYYEKQLENADRETQRYSNAIAKLAILYASLSEFYAACSDMAVVTQENYLEVLSKQIKDQNQLPNVKQIEVPPYAYYFAGISKFIADDYQSAEKLLVTARENNPPKLGTEIELWTSAAQYQEQNSLSKNKKFVPSVRTTTKEQNSEKLFLQALVHGNSHKYDFSAFENEETWSSDRVIKNLLLPAVLNGDYNLVRALWARMQLDEAYFIDNQGKLSEQSYYDPSLFTTLAITADYLAYFFSNIYNSLSIKAEDPIKTHFFRAKYFFTVGDYQKAIEAVEGKKDIQSQLLLFKTHMALSETKEARELYSRISENSAGADLGYIIKTLSEFRSEYANELAILFKAAMEEQERVADTDAQMFLVNCSAYYSSQGQYSEAYDLLAKGFRSRKPYDLFFNEPVFRIYLYNSVLGARLYNKLVTVNEGLEILIEEFPSIRILRNATKQIDQLSLKNIGQNIVN